MGLAGHVELHGKDLTAGKLVAIAEQLSEQVRREKQALQGVEPTTHAPPPRYRNCGNRIGCAKLIA